MAEYSYPLRVVIGVDQLVNTLFGGQPDETLSSRCYRQGALNGIKRWYLLMKVVNTIFFFQKEHCKGAYESEVERKQSPIK